MVELYKCEKIELDEFIKLEGILKQTYHFLQIENHNGIYTGCKLGRAHHRP